MIVDIENLAFGGPGVARVDNTVDAAGVARKLVIFVENVAPGDQVEIELFEIKRSLARGRAVKFIKMSPDRVAPRCPHFGQTIDKDGVVMVLNEKNEIDLSKNCGGCTWQFLSYEKQLEVKNTEVWDALTRIGNFDKEELKEIWKMIMPAADNINGPWYYRNKMEFSISIDKKTGIQHFGLHMRGRYWEVTEVEECFLFRPWVKNFLQPMREFLSKVKLSEGAELKSLIVRSGTNTGEVMVNLLVENDDLKWSDSYLEVVKGISYGDEKLVSVFLTSIKNKKGQPKQFDEKLLWGAPVFVEKLKLDDGREFKFEIAPQAFLQPNTSQAGRFYSLVDELAELTGKENVFDLFCGTGTIGLTLAEKAKKVVGVELNTEAVENAKQNALSNNVADIEFLAGDVTKVLPSMGQHVDIVILDPPRAGLNTDIIKIISDTAAKKVIYVSCNPSTLARDLKDFVALGWKVNFVQPIDQFGQTYHVETVTRLLR